MQRIKTVEPIEDGVKLKRLHLFLTPENIEKANHLLMKAKNGTGLNDDNFSAKDSNSNSNSESS